MHREFGIAIFVAIFVVIWIVTVSRGVQWIVILELSEPQVYKNGMSMRDLRVFAKNGFRIIPWKSSLHDSPGVPIFSNFPLTDKQCSNAVQSGLYPSFIYDNAVKLIESADDGIDTSCEAIVSRGRYPFTPLSLDEKNFPVAFARNVYKNYHIQELLFNLMFAPQNFFCYSIDAKASTLFREQMSNLSSCFPNVIISKKQFYMDSAGHNTSESFIECLRILRKIRGWKYAILLQNDDIPLKANFELVEILKTLNGSNDINVGRPNKDRLPPDADWSYRALNLFYDTNKNDERVLQISKGSTSSALSRGFVEFLIDELNLTTVLQRFNRVNYGVDEMLFSTLHSDDQLNAPGGFTQHCIDVYNNMITRYVSWHKTKRECRSRLYRHGVCIFGLADLPSFRYSRALFANKMLPEYDYSAIACWAKELFNRTYGNHRNRKDIEVRLRYYATRLPVRFNNERDKWRKSISSFRCS